MKYWLKSFGTGSSHMTRHWLGGSGPHKDILEGFATPKNKRPTFQPGDRVVLYASGWQRIFGVVEVTKEAVHNPDWKPWQQGRWTWVVKSKPLLVIPDLEEAPHVGMAAVNTMSLRSQSHIHLSSEQYWHALMSLAGVAGISHNGG